MANVKGGIIAKATVEKAVAPAQRTMKSLVMSMEGQVANAMPDKGDAKRFIRSILTAINTNPQLQQCTPNSFLGAMMQSAQLGLTPNSILGSAYLIPYRNRGQLECQFQLGYRGMVELVYRSGEVTDIQAHAVHANDEFEYELGLEPKLKHKPALTNRGDIVLFYACYRTKNGGFGFQVMSKEDIDAHKNKFSKAANSNFSPWTTNYESMALKTVLKKLLKLAPISCIRQIATDETIKSMDVNDDKDILDANDETVIDITPTAPEVNQETGEVEEEIPFEGSLDA